MRAHDAVMRVAAPPNAREATLVVAGIVAAGVAVDGLLMLLVGAGSLLPPTSSYALVPLLLATLGLVASAGAFALLGRRASFVVRSTAPRLYPFAPVALSAALYVVVLIGVVSVFHGFFDVFTSAHNGGNVGGLSDQSDLSGLIIGASVVVWILTLYTVAVMFRVFQLGRSLDAARGGLDVYGRVQPVGGPLPRLGGSAAPPLPSLARPVLIATTMLLAVVVSAGIQILEVDVGPAPAVDWAWAQAFTPLLTVPLAAALGLVDRGLRGLEERCVRAAAPPAMASGVPASAPER